MLYSETKSSWMADKNTAHVFTIISPEISATICYDPNDFPGIIDAIYNLKEDICSVTGKSPLLNNGKYLTKRPIIIGSPQKSSLIKELIKTKAINLEPILGKWESSYVTVLKNVNDTISDALVITGSDMRAVIYAIYELSEQIGVSPWYWWADVPTPHRDNIKIKNITWNPGEPKVKYRGIFINDEFPCLTSWAKEKFGGVNSLMYRHVYELLLRLKANTLWPAMWGSFKEYKPLVPIFKDVNGNFEGNCFNEDDPNNPRLANEMGIIIGTSHHEPMQRSQQEWIRHKQDYGNSHWNYMTNKDAINRFFKEGIENSLNFENIITIGMRGDEDRPMVDAGSIKANLKLLSTIISNQRNIISKTTGKPASLTPQVLTLYSELLDYYHNGLEIPEDVIIMFCDNNFGDIRSIPSEPHKGGYGMYYHLEYYGGPRACKWLNTMQIQQIWEQMSIAYSSGINQMWMVNVGDIKPSEYTMDFFLRMAWDPQQFTADNLQDYSIAFCAQQFGTKYAPMIASLLNRYCKYASRITPELLDENSYNLSIGEFKMVRDEFLALEAEATRISVVIAKNRVDAYKELVLFPIQALANLYDMYYSLACNRRLYMEKDIKANYWADRVVQCYERDSLLCYDYNHNIANGKWNHMMDQVHIGYSTWNAPKYNKKPEIKYLKVEDSTPGLYIFKNNDNYVVIEAEHYYSASKSKDKEWKVISDYGRTLSGITVYPTNINSDDMSLSYRFNEFSNLPDSVYVSIIIKSVMPFINGGHKIRIGFEGEAMKDININSNLTWEHKYDLMYPTGAERIIQIDTRIPYPKIKSEYIDLKFSPLNPGIVLHKLIISNTRIPDSRLKLVESDYSKGV